MYAKDKKKCVQRLTLSSLKFQEAFYLNLLGSLRLPEVPVLNPRLIDNISCCDNENVTERWQPDLCPEMLVQPLLQPMHKAHQRRASLIQLNSLFLAHDRIVDVKARRITDFYCL